MIVVCFGDALSLPSKSPGSLGKGSRSVDSASDRESACAATDDGSAAGGGIIEVLLVEASGMEDSAVEAAVVRFFLPLLVEALVDSCSPCLWAEDVSPWLPSSTPPVEDKEEAEERLLDEISLPSPPPLPPSLCDSWLALVRPFAFLRRP